MRNKQETKYCYTENERDEAAEGFDRKTQAERISALLEGKPIEGSGDLISVQGKLDLVAFSEGLVKIVDYKLTTAPTEILKKRYRAQLDLYALAVRKAYGEVKIEKYIVVLGRNETIAL